MAHFACNNSLKATVGVTLVDEIGVLKARIQELELKNTEASQNFVSSCAEMAAMKKVLSDTN